ncbi:MAG: hypothetical protein UY61_C0063G0002 [Candidatus Adlerbacteria bacterium GW2011_GWC1_50_9]|uniref:Uncharacterized protein n=1 Tax=Candidatus Adlerbacteria bacterium GW2011_GWC1_50_9 TaxID=1618608 RepID=A0A0G1YVZ5_9BACT|nr:MAG: hypothetical protein UY61_C0063G0002 [Candidatus Adlerbacteria bacterium GW2011_GWC1_50_9]
MKNNHYKSGNMERDDSIRSRSASNGVNLGVNIDFEMDGKGKEYTRPVIVVKKYNQYSFLAIPLSTSKKINKYHIPIGMVANKEAVANVSQMRNIDSKRLVKKIGHMARELFQEIKKKAGLVNFG